MFNKNSEAEVKKILREAEIKIRAVSANPRLQLALYHGRRNSTPNEMLHVIAHALGMQYEDIKNKSKLTEYVILRRVCAMCLYELYKNLDLSDIAYLLGWKDHSTAHYNIHMAQDYLQTKQEHFTVPFQKGWDAAKQWLFGDEEILAAYNG